MNTHYFALLGRLFHALTLDGKKELKYWLVLASIACKSLLYRDILLIGSGTRDETVPSGVILCIIL